MKQALLVIDVQHVLFNGQRRPFEADEVIDRINALTARAREAGVPVVLVQHEYPGSPMEYGSENWQFVKNLVILPGDVTVPKSSPDSFLRTNLGKLLQQWETEQVVVCGYASEFCVDTTVRRAAALGYSVALASDAHTTHDKEHASGAQIRAHHNATLPNMTSFGVKIAAIPCAEITFG
jgi:nicotinamidase-related amidase